MASVAYLRIPEIDGPVALPALYLNWIKALSFHWGVAQPQGARSSGSASISSAKDFSIVKEVDQTSPALFLRCANGKGFDKVQLDMTKAEGRVVTKYAEYVFKEVYISSVRPGGGGGSDVPLEEVSFTFKEGSFKFENRTGNF
jgi:type VI secretion system secreted protein Hcp